ncbi:MAG TPA: hypothetical protein VES20_10950, partial [Bryobacteraceae bacterium]|nr:hypothetical protein [Bryobacteraceae bacterium]
QLWLDRAGSHGNPEEDWFRACEIVRKRRQGNGNNTPGPASYLSGTSRARTETEWKEKARMDNTTMTEQNNQMGSQGGGMMGNVSGSLSGVTERVGQMMENDPKSMPRVEHREGSIARSIEQQTARIPSDAWLWAALGSIGISLALELSGREKTANFVGHWAPTFLIFGLYNKMVKLQGSDGL